MHPYLSHRNYLSPSLPYARAYRDRFLTIGFLRRLMRRAVQQWKRRKMIAALEALDDRILRDIGVHRGEIPSVVAGFDDRELGMSPLAQRDERSAETETGSIHAA